MIDEKAALIGQSLFGFQAALQQAGSSLQEYLENYYYMYQPILGHVAESSAETKNAVEKR